MNMNMNMKRAKSSARISINTRLIAVAVGVFFLMLNLKLDMLVQNSLIALQLLLSIPFLFFSSLAYSKIGYRIHTRTWDRYAWIGFATAYAFIMNVIGVLTGKYINLYIGLIFFLVTWILAISYSFIDIGYDKGVAKERLIKDAYYIGLQVIFGVFVLLEII